MKQLSHLLLLLLFPAIGVGAGTNASAPDAVLADSLSLQHSVSRGTGGLHYGRLALLGAAGSGAHYLSYRYAEHTWWQGQETGGIHFINDWSGETFLNMDKAGHLMSGLFMAETTAGLYRWAGFGPRSAALLGSLTSFGELFIVEWRDGRFDQWGFSIPDLAADAVGAALPTLHEFFPATRAVRFKWSYFPSAQLRHRRHRQELGTPYVDSFIDDYEGMTFWMTADVERLLGVRTPWPDGLGLAVGFGARGMHGANAKSRGPTRGYPELPEARPEVFLSLDVHAPDLPGSGFAWSPIKRLLGFIHLPAPAIRIYPEWAFYLLFF